VTISMSWNRPAPSRGRQHSRRHWPRRIGVGVIVLVVLAVVGGVVQLLRGVPTPTLETTLAANQIRVGTVPGTSGLPWPKDGAAEVLVPGVGTFGPVGTKSPVPIASITKLMTVLVLLHDHPLSLGESGPTITITPEDMALYKADLANSDSTVRIADGENLSEYQALEAMLVPSADNVAQVVAIWDAGSVKAFAAKMNALAKADGLDGCHFVDPSGVDSGSVCTVSDVVKLGELAMANPVVRQIVAMPSVVLPDNPKPAPTFDFVLNDHGIVGVKTGSDGSAGGCFVFAANMDVSGRTELVYGAVLGQVSKTSDLDKALNDAVALIKALPAELKPVSVVHAGMTVGAIHTAWGETVPLETAASLSALAPPGSPVHWTLHVDHVTASTRLHAGEQIGTLEVDLGGTLHPIPVDAEGRLSPPSMHWKLFRL